MFYNDSGSLDSQLSNMKSTQDVEKNVTVSIEYYESFE